MEATVPEEKLGLGVKLGFYVFVSWIGLLVFAFVLSTLGYLIGAAGSVFGAALAANGLATRVFERLPLTAVGLGWHAGSGRNLLIGTGLGAISAALVTFLPALLGLAELVRDESAAPTLGTFVFVSIMLLFGAIGEELLFRGYGFQVVVRLVGPTGALVATGMLFGYVHLQNLNATPLGIANTAGFGVVLGYA
ncbi:MAG: CPBP family intramembrane metalloprotease, partial [Bryobacteraceae bacterium]|nr:CPBP family intramembrane metalloprotease [Bryobacteraceae bacterium]